jgi:hypothetical protein
MCAVLWECMITEMRAVQADLAARAPFAEDGATIRETRGILDDLLRPEKVTVQLVRKSADALAAASAGGFVEVG